MDPTVNTTAPTQPTDSPSGVSPKLVGQRMKTIWKDDIAKDGRKYADIPDEELGAMFIMKNGTTKLPALGISANDKSGDAEKAKGDIVDIAKQMQQVIANKSKYDEKGYKDAINSLASSLILKKKEAENLGAALSGNELGILSGQTPVVQTIGPSAGQRVSQFFTGKEPVQRGEVAEDPETMNHKLALLIAGMSGQKITPEMLASVNPKQTQQQGFLGNVAEDGKNVLNGLLNIPGAIAKGEMPNPLDLVQLKDNPASIVPFLLDKKKRDLALNYGVQGNKASLEEANRVTGRPLEGGDVAGRIAQNAYERPVSTALDVLPFFAEGASSLKGKIATPEVAMAEKIAGAGDKLIEGNRKIDVGANLYGPSKEAGVNQTLNNLNIHGTPGEQYAQLEPKVAELGDQIQTKLQENPQPVKVSQVKKDFMANLKDELLSKTLDAPTARKEIHGLLRDVYGETLGTEITTSDLFSLKQKLNSVYGRIQDKIMRGQPLTDREQVIKVARKTVDDIITSKHKDVKDLTVQQSHLYEAVDSLHSSRNAQSGVPVSIGVTRGRVGGRAIQKGKDAMGRSLKMVSNTKRPQTPDAIRQAINIAYPVAQAGRLTPKD